MMEERNNLLISCGGKWAGMLLQLRGTMKDVPELAGGRILVAAMYEVTPAGCFADDTFVVPTIAHPDYVDSMLEVCSRNGVRVLIPPIDVDLDRLAPHREAFERIGTHVVCPPAELVELCLDKRLFASFAESENLPCPRIWESNQLDRATYPLYYKRRRGFGSVGAGLCQSCEEAQRLFEREADLIFQEYVSGPEFTVDAYISREGRCVVCIPRVRDKVVAGESYQANTVRIPEIRDLAIKTIGGLGKRGLRGPLNVQILLGDKPRLLEVNTRLGSGTVLSNVASGGRLLFYVLSESCGQTVDGDPDDYVEGMRLDRFLGDIFSVDGRPTMIIPSAGRDK